jgi:hypothetical protein
MSVDKKRVFDVTVYLFCGLVPESGVVGLFHYPVKT